MGMTVKDYMRKIDRYEELLHKMQISIEEQVNCHTNKDAEEIIRGKLNFDDFRDLRILLDAEICLMKNLEVKDGDDD